MDPTVWGPSAWIFLHSITMNYDIIDREKYIIFFNSLKDILPCNACREHCKENFNIDPVENNLDSRDQLVNWLVRFHNRVNKSNNKKQYTNSEVMQIYKKLYSKNTSISNNIIIFLLIVIIIFVYKYKNNLT